MDTGAEASAKRTRVFISYSRYDRHFILRLAVALNETIRTPLLAALDRRVVRRVNSMATVFLVRCEYHPLCAAHGPLYPAQSGFRQ